MLHKAALSYIKLTAFRRSGIVERLPLAAVVIGATVIAPDGPKTFPRYENAHPPAFEPGGAQRDGVYWPKEMLRINRGA
jgi:hypothetical protein